MKGFTLVTSKKAKKPKKPKFKRTMTIESTVVVITPPKKFKVGTAKPRRLRRKKLEQFRPKPVSNRMVWLPGKRLVKYERFENAKEELIKFIKANWDSNALTVVRQSAYTDPCEFCFVPYSEFANMDIKRILFYRDHAKYSEDHTSLVQDLKMTILLRFKFSDQKNMKFIIRYVQTDEGFSFRWHWEKAVGGSKRRRKIL